MNYIWSTCTLYRSQSLLTSSSSTYKLTKRIPQTVMTTRFIPIIPIQIVTSHSDAIVCASYQISPKCITYHSSHANRCERIGFLRSTLIDYLLSNVINALDHILATPFTEHYRLFEVPLHPSTLINENETLSLPVSLSP